MTGAPTAVTGSSMVSHSMREDLRVLVALAQICRDGRDPEPDAERSAAQHFVAKSANDQLLSEGTRAATESRAAWPSSTRRREIRLMFDTRGFTRCSGHRTR